ncbi:MAG: phosphoribosylanthranilate isomerase [Pirellulaceae bacterium]
MFRIKICGITTLDDALAAVEAGADAIGLNFFAQSSRCVSEATASELARAIPSHVAKVGVFVNETADRAKQIADRLSLDFIQLHGDEPPSRLAELASHRVIRAFRPSGDFEPLLAYVAACTQLGCPPAAVLVDAYELGNYGGTGKLANWDMVREIQRSLGAMPVILAGGLSPRNVAEAIERAHPAAIDVASGVEQAPGRKSADQMRQFVRAARNAWLAWETP